MTLEIALVLGILVAALLLFVTAWVRMDVVALMVLSTLAITGLVTPAQAVSGFSNAAVITVWSMYILSEGMTRAGIAELIGRRLLRLAGRSETRAIAVLMLVAGTLSAFMNNIGVAALMLPVAVGMARRTGIGSSRLLMPLAYGSLLGGVTTLVGTPPNIIASTALREAGFQPLGFFDFTPLGVLVLLSGTAFVALFGRHLLPKSSPLEVARIGQDLRAHYRLQERIFAVRVPGESLLVGRTLGAAGLGSAAGLIVIASTRAGRTEALPPDSRELQAGDLLLVQGRLDRFDALRKWSELVIEREAPVMQELLSRRMRLRTLRVAEGSKLAGQTIRRSELRQTHGCLALAVQHDGALVRTRLPEAVLAEGDTLLVQCAEDALETLEKSANFEAISEVDSRELSETWQLQERLFVVRVPQSSDLSGVTVVESRLGDAFDFRLLAIVREGALLTMPPPDAEIHSGDLLLVQGRTEDLDVLRGLQQLEIVHDATPYLDVFETGELEVVEAALHPYSTLAGKTIAELDLRERQRIELIALWRNGKPYRSGLGSMVLAHGDALLFVGPRDRLAALTDDPNLIVLNPISAPAIETRKAPVAAGIMLLVVTSVLLGWLPIYIAAVAGATLMVLTHCLTMEQAYRAIEWRSIFLIAGMLPLGVAMQQMGAAEWLARGVVVGFGGHGPWAALMGLYALTAAATLVVPTAALIVLVAPIALTTSIELGASPHAFMIAVALASAASFTSPVAHPANLLVMGPGGYRFLDYIKVGIPLTLVVLVVVAIFLPLIWPLA